MVEKRSPLFAISSESCQLRPFGNENRTVKSNNTEAIWVSGYFKQNFALPSAPLCLPIQLQYTGIFQTLAVSGHFNKREKKQTHTKMRNHSQKNWAQ